MATILEHADAEMICDPSRNTRLMLAWTPRYPTNAVQGQGSLPLAAEAPQGTLVVVGLNPSTATAVNGDGGVLSAIDANPTEAGARTEAKQAAALEQGLAPGAIILDATLNRINRAAAEMGYQRVVMLNAYPFRATSPEGLWAWERSSGFNIFDYASELSKLLEQLRPAAIVVAWGSSMPQKQEDRNTHTRRMANLVATLRHHAPVKCWGLLSNGTPAHPLRLSAERLRRLDDFGAG